MKPDQEPPKMYESGNDISQNRRSESGDTDTANLFTEISCGIYLSMALAQRNPSPGQEIRNTTPNTQTKPGNT